MQEPTMFDLVVIGGGPGGYAAALYGASGGFSVAIVERDKVGGTCLHRGCVPAKEFLETAAVYRSAQTANQFGITSGPLTLDFALSQERKATIVTQLFKGLSGLLKSRKVNVFSGTGTLLSGNKVRIIDGDDAGKELFGRNIVLAAGSVPRQLPGLEIDGKFVISSDEFLDLSRVPSSVAVVGGGAIGCEFASLLADLGSKVVLLEALDTILSGCDAEVTKAVSRSFSKRGIEIITGVSVDGHTPRSDGLATTLHYGQGSSIDVETIISSVGRRPRTEQLLGEGTGVVLDERGFVLTNEYMQTHAPQVWAVGDLVAGTPQLAHVAFAEAIVVIKRILGEPVVPVDYGRVPWAIYCHPEVAFVGLSESQAQAQGLQVIVKTDPFTGNSRARIIGETEGLVKVIAERQSDGSPGRILGVHMVGPWVTEQLGAGYLAVNWEATPNDVAQFIQPHPSLSETFGETVLALTGRGLHVA